MQCCSFGFTLSTALMTNLLPTDDVLLVVHVGKPNISALEACTTTLRPEVVTPVVAAIIKLELYVSWEVVGLKSVEDMTLDVVEVVVVGRLVILSLDSRCMLYDGSVMPLVVCCCWCCDSVMMLPSCELVARRNSLWAARLVMRSCICWFSV